jgi:crotonobetainyl-CoA:carnitine CoA-transferase CaiB-like acyl-CoA transferase
MHRFRPAIEALGRAAGVDALALMAERGEAVTRTCRLYRAADAWVAVNLARPDDVESIPAWLEVDAGPDDVAEVIAARTAAEVVARARLLGLAAAVLGERDAPERWSGRPVAAEWRGRAAPLTAPPVVADWSSLWAGPLCARILESRGARVLERGDVTAADVVIEGSRPRAFEQMGIDAASVTRSGPRVWLSITGHGRQSPQREWIGFGDDCAVAGGLVTWNGDTPAFFADAAADPLTGITAAAAVTTALALGGRWLVDCNLSGVAAHVAR